MCIEWHRSRHTYDDKAGFGCSVGGQNPDKMSYIALKWALGGSNRIKDGKLVLVAMFL